MDFAAFIRSISIRSSNALKVILRVLNIILNFGDDQHVNQRARELLPAVPVHCWLEAVPQVGVSCARPRCLPCAADGGANDGLFCVR